MSDTAYSANVKMHEAKWTDKEGSTVTFRLPMTGMENQRNPFEKWTKRRKGRAGTRYMAVVVEVVNDCLGQTIYKDELMLTGWNDSQSNGHTVKFWLCADVLGHPFEGFERNKDEFHIALVELDDDQEPIDQNMRDKVEAQGKRPSERVSYVAAMLCKNEGFWTYMGHETDADPEERCRENICDRLGIKSRSELDKSDVLAEQFHTEFRKPFVRWQEDS
jgi:hypothetical protein